MNLQKKVLKKILKLKNFFKIPGKNLGRKTLKKRLKRKLLKKNLKNKSSKKSLKKKSSKKNLEDASKQNLKNTLFQYQMQMWKKQPSDSVGFPSAQQRKPRTKKLNPSACIYDLNETMLFIPRYDSLTNFYSEKLIDFTRPSKKQIIDTNLKRHLGTRLPLAYCYPYHSIGLKYVNVNPNQWFYLKQQLCKHIKCYLLR